MTTSEFSNQFDLLVSSYRRFKDFDNRELLDSIEFDEYEKSVYLTKAQEELVLALYNGRNSSLQSFEETEELRRYLSNLVKEVEPEPIVSSSGMPIGIDTEDKKTTFYSLPTDMWFIVYESVKVSDGACGENYMMQVVPVTLDRYHRIRNNPFRGLNNRRSLRLDLSEGVVEIVSKYTVTNYYVRYLKKPTPIILTNLPDGITIDGMGTTTQCRLHEALHNKILEDAVHAALRSKGYDINNKNNK